VQVLVTGATGFIGRSLVPTLDAQGHDVRAGTRRPESYRGGGLAVAFDVEDPSTLDAALEGCDAAYYLVHGMAGSGDFEKRDRHAAETFADAAARRGAKVIYLGGLGDQESTAGRSAHLRSRHEVGAVLRDRSETVELQAAIVIGNGSVAFEIMRQLVHHLPVMVCPSWVTTRSQPIALDDMIRYLVAGLDLAPERYPVGGADILTYEEMMSHYARITGRRRLVIKVPVLTPGLSAHWIGLVTDQSAQVARYLAEGLSVEVITTDDRIRNLVPFEPMGFDDAVLRALASRPAS